MVDFFKRDHPFSDLDSDEIKNIMIEMSKTAVIDFDASLAKLIDTIKKNYPIHLLTKLSHYALTEGISDNGERIEKDVKVTQPHIELIQALYLKELKDTAHKLPPATAEQIQSVIDILPELSRAYSYKRLKQIQDANSDEEKAILALQERLRVHTQSVRNWGYLDDVSNFADKIYSKADSYFQSKYGIQAVDIIKVFKNLIDKNEKKLTEWMEKLREIRAQTTIDDIVKLYCQKFDLPTEQATKLISMFKSIDECFIFAVEHSYLFMVNYFTIIPSDLESELGIKTGCLEILFNDLSYSFGDLEKCNVEHVFLDNPIWTKPLIKNDNNNYACVFPQIFFSYIFQTLDSLFKEDEKFNEKIAKYKSDFLESEIEIILTNSFPSASIVANYKWEVEKGLVYETDLIMKFDTHLLIVEAKSGKIDKEALRGAPDSLKENIESVLIEPARQSQRLYELLIAKTPPSGFPFDLPEINHINRLSITLEDFGTVQSDLKDIKSTGWFDDDVSLPPTMCLSDFSVVMEILDTTSSRLHYLKRRDELQKHKKYFGCEIDLLGLYLDTGFDLGDEEFSDVPITLLETSKPIDDYCVLRGKVNDLKKPEQKITQWWKDIIKRLEDRAFKGWTEISTVLLNYTLKKQENMCNEFEKIKNNCFLNEKGTEFQNSFFCVPNKKSQIAIAFIVYRDYQDKERYEIANNIATQAFEELKTIEKCVVFGFNVDNKESYPYRSMMMLERNK